LESKINKAEADIAQGKEQHKLLLENKAQLLANLKEKGDKPKTRQ